MMTDQSQKKLVSILLARYGQTYASETGIRVTKNTPAPLFQLLNLSLLLSTQIPAENATRAARALIDAGLTTPKKIADASWQQRVDVLTWHGCKRFDERTATMLGETAERLLRDYGGDLRKLRKASGRNVRREKVLLQRFSGVGPPGADIFLREVQSAWPEVYPYADRRVLDAAGRLGLPVETHELAALVTISDFPNLTAALVRVDLDKGYDEIYEAA